MVYTVPPRNAPNASLGNQLGQSLSQGFLSAAQPAIQQQYQRGQLQKALQGMQGIANDPNATPYDIASALIGATSQIPGSERYVGQLYDSLMRTRQTQNFFGNQGGQQSGNTQQRQSNPQVQSGSMGSQGNFNPQPMQSNSPNNPLIQNQSYQGIQPAGGQTPQLNLMSPEEIEQESYRRAQALNDPSSVGREIQNLTALNEERRKQQEDVVKTQALETKRQEDILNRDNQLRDFITPKLKTGDPEEINDFMLIGQLHDNLKNNPSAWYEATKKDFSKYMNAKTALENAYIPGMGKGLIRGGNNREQRELELKRLDPIVKDLVKYGKEEYARKKLADLYLSPTEIEERIHPLSQEAKQGIEKLPRAPYESYEALAPTSFKELGQNIYSGVKAQLTGRTEGKSLKSYDELLESNPKIIEQTNQNLSNFLKDNLSNDSSLLVLRDNLVNKKGYDWRQFSDALNLAEENGLELNPAQQAERAELTRPPIQSLPSLFNEWGNWIDYLRGNK